MRGSFIEKPNGMVKAAETNSQLPNVIHPAPIPQMQLCRVVNMALIYCLEVNQQVISSPLTAPICRLVIMTMSQPQNQKQNKTNNVNNEKREYWKDSVEKYQAVLKCYR